MPPMVEPQTAKAIARCLPVNSALTVDRVAGRIIAAPTPCTNRAPISAWPVAASPAATLARVNRMIPTRNTLRRPCRSPILPTVSSRAANTRE